MTLFTVGPVEMYPETLEVSGKQLPYFRTDSFSEITLDSEKLLKKLSFANNDSEVVFLTSSGTGAMEATVMNCFTPDEKLLIVSGGSFGERFCQIASIHKIPFDVISLEFGQVLSQEILEEYDNRGYSALLINADETSTGQLYDLKMVSDFCKKNSMFFIVDAISSFLADEINFSELSIDAMIISSQKALSLSPGLSVVIISSRINEKIQDIESGSLYFDFKDHIRNGKRGQTPFTPAVGIMLELNNMLHMIDSESIDCRIKKTKNNAQYFRNLISNLPVDLPEYPLSNAVTPIIFREPIAYSVFTRLRDEYDLVLTPSGGDLKNRMLRVSHIGNLSSKDYDRLYNALKEVLL